MTKRRTIIAAFLLIAVLVMGIGYATLVDELSIKGTAGISSFDADIKFIKVEVDDEKKFERIEFSDDHATMNVAADVLHDADDFITAKFTICNTSSYAVQLTAAVTNDDQNNFKVETDWTTKEVAAGVETVITVKVTALTTPTSDELCSFEIDINASTVEDI